VEPVKGPEAIKVKRLADGGTLYSSSTGLMQTHDLGRGVILHIRSGTMDLAFARRAREHCEQQIQHHKRCVLMVDGYLTKMHTTEFRELTTRWFAEHEQAVVHMLVRSPMVEMALNVANLVLGARRAHTYTQVADWEEVGRKEVPGFTRRPLLTE
jgi:hypothetical protein